MNQVNFKFENGIKVKDTITGMKGTITASAVWLNGCERYCVQPKAKKDTAGMPDSYWVDVQQLEAIDSEPVPFKKTGTGGPSDRMSANKL